MAGLEVSLGEVLLEKGWSLAVAESCTGGLLGARITSVPGSSGYFKGGVIAYSNQLKEDLLGVPAELIERAGAVSSEAALAMASGLKRLGVQVGVAITGVAGPDGGTPVNPVGTTWIGVVMPGRDHVQRFQWSGTRDENRLQSVEAALMLVLHVVRGEDGQPFE
jgi:PncC family amidohydrolase